MEQGLVMRLDSAQVNRIGDRTQNQDRAVLVQDQEGVLLAVADGMGGHARGELAAQAFIDAVSRRFRNRVGIEDPRQFLGDCFADAQRLILAAGATQNPPVRPLTTGVLCLVQNDTAHWAHVGDSRLYLLRNGKIWTRTTDHSRVAELVDAGVITEQQARSHPLRNQVSQCLGGDERSATPTLSPSVYLQDNDVLLLCTDGFWSPLPDSRLLALLKPDELAAELETLASAAEWSSYPGSDNITAVALRWQAHAVASPAHAGLADQVPAVAVSADPVEQAIADIENALAEYGDEMDKTSGG